MKKTFQRKPKYLRTKRVNASLRPVTEFDRVVNSFPDATLCQIKDSQNSIMLMDIGDWANSLAVAGNYFTMVPSGDWGTLAPLYNKFKVVKTTIVCDFFMNDPTIPPPAGNVLKVGITQLPANIDVTNVGAFNATRQAEELPYTKMKAFTTEGGGAITRVVMSGTPLKSMGDRAFTDGFNNTQNTKTPTTRPVNYWNFLVWASHGQTQAAQAYSISVFITRYSTVKFYHRKLPGQD